jgi:hypothetical protein
MLELRMTGKQNQSDEMVTQSIKACLDNPTPPCTMAAYFSDTERQGRGWGPAKSVIGAPRQVFFYSQQNSPFCNVMHSDATQSRLKAKQEAAASFVLTKLWVPLFVDLNGAGKFTAISSVEETMIDDDVSLDMDNRNFSRAMDL